MLGFWIQISASSKVIKFHSSQNNAIESVFTPYGISICVID